MFYAIFAGIACLQAATFYEPALALENLKLYCVQLDFPHTTSTIQVKYSLSSDLLYF